jgi:hypothetical protein
MAGKVGALPRRVMAGKVGALRSVIKLMVFTQPFTG